MEHFIETERLLIRPFTLNDVEAIHKVFGDPVAMKYIPSGPSKDLARSRERIEFMISMYTKSAMSLQAIIEKKSKELIGDCGVFLVEGVGPEYEVGYHFRQDVWGKGFATEAATACVNHAFENGKMDEILALALPANKASIRVMKKIGMEYRRMDNYYNTNVVVYSKLRNEKLEHQK